jgi:hypothetical protein
VEFAVKPPFTVKKVMVFAVVVELATTFTPSLIRTPPVFAGVSKTNAVPLLA